MEFFEEYCVRKEYEWEREHIEGIPYYKWDTYPNRVHLIADWLKRIKRDHKV